MGVMRRIIIDYEQGEDGDVLRCKSDFKPETTDDFIAGDYATLFTIGVQYYLQYGKNPDFESGIAAESAQVAANVILEAALSMIGSEDKPPYICEECKNKQKLN